MHHSVAMPRQRTRAEYVKRVLIMLACALVIVKTGALPATFTSPARHKLFVYPSVILFSGFILMWVYTAAYLERRDSMWFRSHVSFLKTATATLLLSALLWVLGMWPVYGVWTGPLYVVAVIFLSHLAGILPSPRVKVI